MSNSKSYEEIVLEMILRERHPETLEKALAEGKTIKGAWNYVVSVMKNAYIAANGRVNGGCCGNPDVVVGIAERYLREFPEGTVEPETPHTPKKKPDEKSAHEKIVDTAKAAAKAASDEAKKRNAAKVKAAMDYKQMCFNF